MANPYRYMTAVTEQDVLVLTIDVEQVKDYVVAEELRYELVHAAKRGPAKKVVLDLRKMTFMTSLACVAFIGLKHCVRERGGRLLLCNVSEFIRRVFNAKRLLTPSQYNGNVAFEEVGTLSDALSALSD